MDWPQRVGIEAAVRVGDDSIDRVQRAIFAPLSIGQPLMSFDFVEWHRPRQTRRRESSAAFTFELSQALILVAGLNRDAIIEAVELAREIGQRFAGLL